MTNITNIDQTVIDDVTCLNKTSIRKFLKIILFHGTCPGRNQQFLYTDNPNRQFLP